MTRTESGGTVRVRVGERQLNLVLPGRDHARFVPVHSRPLPEHIEVYPIGSSWGEELTCTPAARDRWRRAERAYLDAVSRAVEELHGAHGGHASVNLYGGSSSFGYPDGPFPWPGRRRRMAARSAAAQRVFLLRLQEAEDAYRPVREELSALLAARRAERAAAEEARLRAAKHRRRVVADAAERRLWVYSLSEDAATVHIRRTPEPSHEPSHEPEHEPECEPECEPEREPETPSPGSPSVRLTARELEARLVGPDLDRVTRFVWDPEALAQVERECRDAGVEITFRAWWDAVTLRVWKEGPSGPCPVKPAPHTTSRPTRYIPGGSATSGTGGYTGGGFSF